jgi:nucleoside-diphosphate-sugar epimerase
MIIGSGMLANAFRYSEITNSRICIFASGVSNSNCNDVKDFNREAALLRSALMAYQELSTFVYFGTCSIYDPASQSHPYVLHKLTMERLVLDHPAGLVIRLPQVVGPNASPYTLVSSLCESIRFERTINLWEYATRNIIDVGDVVKIVTALISSPQHTCKIINVANPFSYSIRIIIESIEMVLGRKAILNVVPLGAAYEINIELIEPLIKTLGLNFGRDYLTRVIGRYYS